MPPKRAAGAGNHMFDSRFTREKCAGFRGVGLHEFGGRSQNVQASAMHQTDARANSQGFANIVRYEYRGLAQGAAQVEKLQAMREKVLAEAGGRRANSR